MTKKGTKRKLWGWGKVFLLVLICSLVTVAIAALDPAHTATEPDVKPTAHLSFNEEMASVVSEAEGQIYDNTFYAWYDAYTQSRIVPIILNDRGPLRYGPWAARSEKGTEDASSDGALTEWATNYYIAHDWSDYGQEILTMQPGDEANVNGKSFTVEGIFNYPKDSFYEEIMRIAGDGAIVFQTCYPDSTFNRIVYGR